MADHNFDHLASSLDHHMIEKHAEDLKEEDFPEDEGKLPEDRNIDALSEHDNSLNLEDERTRISIEELEESIIKYCRDHNSLYEDDTFPAGPPSLYNDPSNVPDYDRGMGCEQWLYPKDLAENPVLFANGINPGDIQQGALGDCWFLGSLCCLATTPHLLERLFVNTEHFLDCGFVTCQFFKNGSWQQVLIDTRIPYNSSCGSPIYGHCKDPNEMWLPLIEKAYAKLHRTYENLNGGKMTDALVDLTGEASEKYNLRDPKVSPMVDSGDLWAMMMRFFRQGSLVGCANNMKEEGEQGEEMGGDGIWNNHSYGIMDIRDTKNLRLIRIRNPWGEGEWKGTFGDEDEEWDKHRGLKDELNYEFGKDGTWWMAFEDWVKHYNRLYIGRIFPDKWHKFSIDGRWEGKTVGGCPPMTIDRDEEVAEHIKMDSDDKWFNNPQYRITIKKKTHVFISLMQADQRLSGLQYIPCNFLVIKTADKKNRIWEKDKDDVIASAAEGMQRVGQREITKDILLEVPEGKKEAHFIIVPNLEIDGKRLESEVQKKKGRQFWLRIFAQNPLQVQELADTFEVIDKGEWNEVTAGGRRVVRDGRDNPLWCRNPQYFLNVSAVTLLKVILRKIGRFRQAKGHPVGIVVCQAPVNQSSKKNQPVATKKFKTTSIVIEKEKEAEVFEKERKLQILPNEWFVESHYQYEEYSCLYLKLEQNHGPFLIVPSLSQEGIQCSYSLTIYSNNPVSLDRLKDSQNIVVSGEWKQSSAGGSHLYDSSFVRQLEKNTWLNNPRYLLKFLEDRDIRAKITLSRPERLWSKKIARNTVGCMMGLYIFEAEAAKMSVESWLRKPEFMPLNEIEEILEKDNARAGGFIIMPTTYESGMKGPFVLSVSSENEFSLTEIVDHAQ